MLSPILCHFWLGKKPELCQSPTLEHTLNLEHSISPKMDLISEPNDQECGQSTLSSNSSISEKRLTRLALRHQREIICRVSQSMSVNRKKLDHCREVKSIERRRKHEPNQKSFSYTDCSSSELSPPIKRVYYNSEPSHDSTSSNLSDSVDVSAPSTLEVINSDLNLLRQNRRISEQSSSSSVEIPLVNVRVGSLSPIVQPQDPFPVFNRK